MKNKKIKYSLTAKQRKEQRLERESKVSEKKVKDEPMQSELQEQTVDGAAAEATAKKTVLGLDIKRFVLLTLCIVFAAALIIVAVLLPTVIIPRATYSKVNNPVAVIYLSNGETLEFEIYEKEVPNAATNFLYLAKKGYFNGSIIFDRQNSYIRFGGFYDTSYNHRETDAAFSAKYSDITSPSGKYKFQYRLSADTSNTAKNFGQEAGYLSFMQNSSSTEFQICTVSGSPLTAANGDNTPRTVNAIAFGRYLNQNVMDKLTALYESMDNVVEHGNYWKYPAPVITIKKIKLYNMDKAKWKNFNFDEFFKDKISGWTGGSID